MDENDPDFKKQLAAYLITQYNPINPNSRIDKQTQFPEGPETFAEKTPDNKIVLKGPGGASIKYDDNYDDAVAELQRIRDEQQGFRKPSRWQRFKGLFNYAD